jgi:hypothetical protein
MRFVLTALLLAATLPAQDRRAPATFVGVVWEESTQRGIDAAEVLLPKLNLRAVSDSNGVFQLRDVPPGTHELTVRRLGFDAYTSKVGFNPGETLRQRVYLRRVVQLDSITVSGARSSGIPEVDQRRHMKIGVAITREQLDKKEASRLGDLVGDLPGVVARRTRQGGTYALNSRGIITINGNNRSCYVMVYLDDSPVYRGDPGEPLFDLNSITPRSLEAVEYFAGPSQVPAKYNKIGATCGVLLLWTRRR